METTQANSLEAYESVAPHLRDQQTKVLNVLRAAPGGLIDEVGVEASGMIPSSYRTRRRELVDLGLVRQVGNERTRSGRRTAIWAAV